ncbi:hypothetical protein [Occallatibacter savannae]|uniref:hypothetical protein n=1 Tax=Occallatibacter savannae TaxID=1002691 RepID=UPI000D689C37|nr:hypothetical protein [Occallatibacter savannae]
MNPSQSIEIAQPRRSSVTPLTVFLCFIMVFFCAVLVFVYAATKRANPVMLDQQGHPLPSTAERVK